MLTAVLGHALVMWVLCSMAAIMSMHVLPDLQLVQGILLAAAHSCNLHLFVCRKSTISLAMMLILQRGTSNLPCHIQHQMQWLYVLALMKAAAAQGMDNSCGFPF